MATAPARVFVGVLASIDECDLGEEALDTGRAGGLPAREAVLPLADNVVVRPKLGRRGELGLDAS